ncbi:Hypothetical protein CINCED_3A007990 [Cinara cedri]|uniref:Uncharacterized protein n=1 Tax=Cinara cedri TaxID=506608 RepID=A0A5E4M3U7_9HEMI|nr:Hypothetical protein CINCED_3A007990 [Cinara cedri]
MESIKDTESKKTYSIKNNAEVKQNEPPFNKFANSQFVTNFSSLHDPYDLNHIHGLRNRLFKTFNTFATILENALLPPVLKSTKKLQIKIKECDQQTNINYILDFNLMLSEIKNESKNENLHSKKNKSNAMLKTSFQIKVIQCYKLAINATELCSKTLEANIYNPIQSKMKNLIQLISTLSFTTGKYIYGVSFKKKKKESFDLVARCKELVRMLDESGYKETQDEVHDNSVLNQITNKALAKPKTQFLLSNPKRLSMYSHSKPKLGSMYAQRWSKKNQDIDKNDCNTNSEINEKPLLLNSIVSENHTFDNIKTVIQEYPIEEHDINETNKSLSIEKKGIKDEKIENYMFINYTDEVTNFQTSSKPKLNKLKTPNNVKLFIVKENIWRNFFIKNICLSQNGCLRLNINLEEVQIHLLHKRQFKQMSLTTVSQVDTISK